MMNTKKACSITSRPFYDAHSFQLLNEFLIKGPKGISPADDADDFIIFVHDGDFLEMMLGKDLYQFI
ncbi:Uncharacterised protein [Chlamydia trachomatis]|nr:Uncharacterised protein [Chlamydia trachomatis]